MLNFRKITISITVVFLSTTVLYPNCVLADEIKEVETTPNGVIDNWPLLQASEAENKKYRGVASMDYNGYECTSFLIKPPNCSNLKAQKAIMVTNGHCTKALDPQKVLSQVDSTIPKFKFGQMNGAKESEIVDASGSKILYSTMREKDLAIIELDKTYGELEAQGIPAYEMAPAVIPQAITTVGRPVIDVPKSERFLREAQCRIEKRTGVVEGDWHWPVSVAANCPAVGGASGSPMFNNSGQVVGILNSASTSPAPASPKCVTDSPCEIGLDGKTMFVLGKAYGFETGFLNACFNKCSWDVGSKNCDLAKEGAPDLKISPSSMQKLDIKFTLPTPYTHAKYKMVPLSTEGCSDPNGYLEAPVKKDFNRKLRVSLGSSGGSPSPEGKYQLCVLSGTTDSSGKVVWDDVSKVYAKNITIDRTSPRAKIEIKKDVLLPSTENPIDMADVTFVGKFVSTQSECAKKEAYVDRRGPPWRLPTSEGSFFCVMAVDKAGNWQEQPLIFDNKGQVQ
jgi:hypothetical protein